MRKIIHIDMDCFYAAIEMRESPEWVGHPIAIGGTSRRGVICTCNYEARKYGVRSAMPAFKAVHLCPRLKILPLRFDMYRRDSKVVRDIMLSYTPWVEPLSLDEAYLDVTEVPGPGAQIALEIRQEIFRKTQLTASAGIAPNKMLAKICSDWKKPNGQFVLEAHQIEAFMKELPVRKIWGVGPKAGERLSGLGIKTCGDLQKVSLTELSRQFGQFGVELYQLSRGVDGRRVRPDRIRKSMSNERTFGENLSELGECEKALRALFDELLEDIEQKCSDRKIIKAFVKIKFEDFTKTTAECSLDSISFEVFRKLLCEAFKRQAKTIRLMGVGVRFKTGTQVEQLEFKRNEQGLLL